MVNLFENFDPSQALQSIVQLTKDTMLCETPALPDDLILEAMAQACGLHVRWRHDFMVTAYLASCRNLSSANTSPCPAQLITVRLLGQTTTAARYEVLTSPSDLTAHIVIGYAPSNFQEHFAQRFQCLLSSKTCI